MIFLDKVSISHTKHAHGGALGVLYVIYRVFHHVALLRRPSIASGKVSITGEAPGNLKGAPKSLKQRKEPLHAQYQ